MLSWVVKVVPQPPEPPAKKAEENKEEKPAAAPPPPAPVAPAAPPPAAPPAADKKVTFKDESKNESDKPKQDGHVAEANSAQPGVLTWISSTLPQPASSPKVTRANSVTKEENTTTRKGMIAWIAQGLEKVVPHPDVKQPAQACPAPAAPAPAPPAPAPPPEPAPAPAPPPKPQVTVVEVKPKAEEKTEKTENKPSVPPSMIDWLKQGIEKVVPQPSSGPVKNETPAPAPAPAPAPVKVEAPPPEPPPPAPAPKPAPEAEKPSNDPAPQSNMMGWIVSEIGRMLPQPVPKPDSGDEVQNISITQKTNDLVLVDLEQNEPQIDVKEEEPEPEPEPQPEPDPEPEPQVQPEPQPEPEPEPQTKPNHQESAQVEDVEQWAPLKDSIKKETGEVVLAHMEERLQQDRLEAARAAEEMARKAAEEAVRQLEVEHSAKIVIETLPDTNEQQLPNILEEENEDDPELQNLHEESEDSTENHKLTEDINKNSSEEDKKIDEEDLKRSLVDVCPAEDGADAPTQTDKVESPPDEAKAATPTESEAVDEGSPSSTEAEPASERREGDSPVSQPITTQPESQNSEAPPPTNAEDTEATTEEGGSGVPVASSPIKSFLLRFPPVAECLESCQKLMHDNYLTPPKLSMPVPSLELAPLTQCCMSLVSRFRGLTSSSQQTQEP